jgi:hypothetical protein
MSASAGAFVFSCCLHERLGCTDPTASNYVPAANSDDGTCVHLVAGCNDLTAINADSLADIYDASCVYPITGCTDVTARNFAADANVDDAPSCEYDVLVRPLTRRRTFSPS